MQRPHMSATRGIQARHSETLRLTLFTGWRGELNAELRSADVVRARVHSAAEALGTPYASLVSLRRGEEIDHVYALGRAGCRSASGDAARAARRAGRGSCWTICALWSSTTSRRTNFGFRCRTSRCRRRWDRRCACRWLHAGRRSV